MDDILQDLIRYRFEIFEKIMEPLDNFILAKLKTEQLRQMGFPVQKELEDALMLHKDEISEILLQQTLLKS